ncbi:hypothetical protein Y032_0037g3447 [Ancylostoma ceylanicum]|nr:hypothetical protein Y032_0037g3447 [Ancylostoma ceylanicum]
MLRSDSRNDDNHCGTGDHNNNNDNNNSSCNYNNDDSPGHHDDCSHHNDDSRTSCCPALMQTLTSSEFPDGLMTFFYNNDTCRTMVTAVCSQTDPAFDLYAAIVANGQFFLDYGPNNISFPGTCNTTLQRWEMGTPPLIINTIECRLTNPPSGG